MKPYTESEPVFSESIQITEPTDPAHADNINAGPKQLLQNTLVNKKEIEDLKQGNNEVEFDDTVIPGEGEEPEGVPDPAEALEQITSGKSVPVLIGHIKRTLTGLLSLSQRALNIAMGKNQARVFATVEALDAWLSVPEHTAELKVGDNFYITAVDVPDYWWDGTQKQKLETQKVDLTTYDRKIAALEAKDSELNGNLSSHSHAWTAITGKPSVYTPADHNHDGRYYIEAEVNNLLDGKAPAVHNHEWIPFGSFTGNKTLSIPIAATGTKEIMLAWRYDGSTPWKFVVYRRDGTTIFDSYYYNENYNGCVAAIIDNGVLKMNPQWCTCKHNGTVYKVDNVNVWAYYR